MSARYAQVELSAADIMRFWSHVDQGNEERCWPWRAALNDSGYGAFQVGGRCRVASRIAWQITHGTTPMRHVCHSCDNPVCVNPAHLWLGTDADNLRDMASKGRAFRQTATHCKNGHEFTVENTYHPPHRLWNRACRACNRANVAKYQRGKKAVAK